MVKGKTVGIDATTLEANEAMRSIVLRDTGQRQPRRLSERTGQGIRNRDAHRRRLLDRRDWKRAQKQSQ